MCKEKKGEQEANFGNAMRFIVMLGLVSLFGDITYETARGVTGPYLNILGATGLAVGIVAGLGEFLGYALRLASGYLADKTKNYWGMTFFGYGMLLSIPMLALAGKWEIAGLFLVLERIGKAVRSPARDALLSHATKVVGRGRGFGLHEAIDQFGAILGPLFFAAVLFSSGGSGEKAAYRHGFALLLLPALLSVFFLFLTRMKHPHPEEFETSGPSSGKKEPEAISPLFWVYTSFVFFSVMSFVTFPLIGFHFKKAGVVSDVEIAILYAIAMAVDCIVALIIGRLYDKIGLSSLIMVPFLTLLLPFAAFADALPFLPALNKYAFVLAAVSLWGAVMGAHETIMRAAVADLTHIKKRGFAYGIFNTAYGLAFLAGGGTMGYLYDKAPIVYVIAFSLGTGLIALVLFFVLRKMVQSNGGKNES